MIEIKIPLKDVIIDKEIDLSTASEQEATSSSNAWNVVENHPHERIGFPNLTNWLKNYGISGALNFLLPVLFSEEMISTECLNICQRAYNKRNNIVHNASRDVNKEETQEYSLTLGK